MSRKVIIGDLHGCLDELNALLDRVGYRPGDQLYFTGDLMDRGTDSIGCLRRARALNAITVIGNHDDKYVRYRKHERARTETGKKNPMKIGDAKRAIYEQLTDTDFAYIEQMPLYVMLQPGLVLVHAGLSPLYSVQDQKPGDLTHIRYIDPVTGKSLSLDKDFSQPPESIYWTEAWKGPESVIYGHNATSEPVVDEPALGVKCIGIDTGCAFGGCLTALILPEMEFVQVPALRAYSPRALDRLAPRSSVTPRGSARGQ
jgi:bis(5'-nucleosyl)-tetraphosphatase (symmetrical)